ncbi:hypothetical protein DRO27_02515 [Candidatus Bathyarchaeota archaeon]|nr:MAG: hypothetical protein DRO27_02515 [Candidatus Bathyarchaeota archaeon]
MFESCFFKLKFFTKVGNHVFIKMRRNGFRHYTLLILTSIVIIFLGIGVAHADIDGVVLDPEGQPVEMVNVTFFRNFLRIGVVSTDASGLFSMELDEGYYVCQV